MEFYNIFLRTLVEYQYELNRYISSTIRSINDENSLTVSLTVLGIAFIYGLVHAAGPGHGKALVSFYFISNKSNYVKAFKMGYIISIVHAISALFFTFTIYFVLKVMFRQNFNEFSTISMIISSVMIILVGIYLIIHSYLHRKERNEKVEKVDNRSEYAIAFSAGVVPCPGVMTIVLFCIMLKEYLLGFMAAISMSIGMGFTISIAGILSISFNKRFRSFFSENGYVLEIFGGVLILFLGVFLLSTYL